MDTSYTSRFVIIGWPAKTYIHLLCVDTGCILEDLQGAVDDKYGWWSHMKDNIYIERERERESDDGNDVMDLGCMKTGIFWKKTFPWYIRIFFRFFLCLTLKLYSLSDIHTEQVIFYCHHQRNTCWYINRNERVYSLPPIHWLKFDIKFLLDNVRYTSNI